VPETLTLSWLTLPLLRQEAKRYLYLHILAVNVYLVAVLLLFYLKVRSIEYKYKLLPYLTLTLESALYNQTSTGA